MLKSFKRRLFRDIYDRLSSTDAALQIFMRSPEFVFDPTVGFNGQQGRKKIFAQLIDAFEFANIVETGTFEGATSGYMATVTKLPVRTCELIPVFYWQATKRLAALPNVYLANDDSPTFLRRLSQERPITDQPCFIYLDAHWGRDLPLKTELDIIAQHWRQFVVMIDDFQVPGQRGYGYDRHGLTGKINIAYIRPVLADHDLSLFFPTLPADQETGAKRGCAVLVRDGQDAELLASLTSLRLHTF